MSIQQFPGGIITQNPTAPTGPYQDSAAPGIWTLDEVTNFIKQGIWPTAGNTNPDAFIENLFSTYLYPSTSSTDNQIVNGIDLAGKGGLVWIKSRTRAATNNYLIDTVRGSSLGNSNGLVSNSTAAQQTGPNLDYLTFNSNGFTAKAVVGGGELGTNTYYGSMVGWTFRKQPKFFDVVTYTGNGVSGRQIPHNLGSTPGFVVVKNITSENSWYCWHRSVPGSGGFLETTDAFSPSLKYICGTVNSTVFSVDSAGASVNGSGQNYVAYLYAHDAGGFGLTGTDNVVSCGGFTANGSGQATVNLGYEPQLVLYKLSSTSGPWQIMDSMRGMPDLSNDLTTSNTTLFPNTSAVESGYDRFWATSTGFYLANGTAGATYIYMAIRRGPMKVPTDGTKVFNPAFYGTNGVFGYLGAPTDMNIYTSLTTPASTNPVLRSRLVGGGNRVTTSNTDAEVADAQNWWDNMVGANPSGETFTLNSSRITFNFRRAPGFFDEVCYTGTSTNTTQTHNLSVAPELIIVKCRNISGYNWPVYSAATGATKLLELNTTAATTTSNLFWNNTAPTSTVFSLGTDGAVNGSTDKFVAYLFATCPGVSKVGSYTGTAATQVINCGFTAGARFVLIKRTDSTGDWYVWDSARGIVSGDDPYILLNSTAAEVTGTDYVDANASGFEITSTAPAAINASGGSYIFLAIS